MLTTTRQPILKVQDHDWYLENHNEFVGKALNRIKGPYLHIKYRLKSFNNKHLFLSHT